MAIVRRRAGVILLFFDRSSSTTQLAAHKPFLPACTSRCFVSLLHNHWQPAPPNKTEGKPVIIFQVDTPDCAGISRLPTGVGSAERQLPLHCCPPVRGPLPQPRTAAQCTGVLAPQQILHSMATSAVSPSSKHPPEKPETSRFLRIIPAGIVAPTSVVNSLVCRWHCKDMQAALLHFLRRHPANPAYESFSKCYIDPLSLQAVPERVRVAMPGDVRLTVALVG